MNDQNVDLNFPTSMPSSSCSFGNTNIAENEMCEQAQNLFDQVMDGETQNSDIVSAARQTLAECEKCQNALDIQLKLRETMNNHLRVAAPQNLRIEISANLKRMDLGKLDITDFFPPNV